MGGSGIGQAWMVVGGCIGGSDISTTPDISGAEGLIWTEQSCTFVNIEGEMSYPKEIFHPKVTFGSEL